MKRWDRDYIRDLIVDIRCADRDGLEEYAAKCRRELRRIWGRRKTPGNEDRADE